MCGCRVNRVRGDDLNWCVLFNFRFSDHDKMDIGDAFLLHCDWNLNDEIFLSSGIKWMEFYNSRNLEWRLWSGGGCGDQDWR